MSEIIIGSGQAQAIEPNLATHSVKNQNGSISPTILAAVTPGLYRLSITQRTVRAGSGHIDTTISLTDDTGAITLTTPGTMNLTGGNSISGSVIFWAEAGTVKYTVTQAGSGTYHMTMALEKLS